MKAIDAVDILLVEDDATDAELTIQALEQQNLVECLVHLRDGAEALDFLDLQIPGISGIQVLARIKSTPHTKRIPVVVFTSSKQKLDMNRCYQLGANSYIVKPVDSESFLRTISDVALYWLQLNHPSL